MNKLRIGVMGCAQIAKRSMIPAIKSDPAFELIAVSSRSKAKGRDFANEFDCEFVHGYSSLIDRIDIDAIYMPLPTGLHEEWIEKALLSGKHLLVEKSIALDSNSAVKMIELARKSNKLLMEDFMFLYHRQHHFVQKLISDYAIGDLRCFRSSFGFPPLDKTNFRYDPVLGGGALLDAGAYTVRAAQLFLGHDLSVLGSSIKMDQQGTDIWGSICLRNEAGVMAQLSFGFDNFYQCTYELWGTLGKITCKKAFTPGPQERPVVILEKQNEEHVYTVHADNHFQNILKEFRKRIIAEDFSVSYQEVINQSQLLDVIKSKNTIKNAKI